MFCWLFKAVRLHSSITCLERAALPPLPLPPSIVFNAGLSAIRTITGIMEVELCKEMDCSNGGAICPADACAPWSSKIIITLLWTAFLMLHLTIRFFSIKLPCPFKAPRSMKIGFSTLLLPSPHSSPQGERRLKKVPSTLRGEG
jgi:hypothetical protein